MDIFNNHKHLYSAATVLFIVLSIFVAVAPSINNERNNGPLPDSRPLSAEEEAGRQVYISNGCIGCHSQQVRNVDMDKVWGSRPGIAADYAHSTRPNIWQNAATMMGTERTGPDLTNIGTRQPSQDWNLVHLYNPRIVVQQSIMPSYPWLFEVKGKADSGDVKINVPAEYMHGKKGVVVAKKEALQLVAYLQSLKQSKLPDGIASPDFLYKTEKKLLEMAVTDEGAASRTGKLDGKALYNTYCQSCHQENGEGVKGAFPPLKGSGIVLNENIESFVEIIMKGYDARPDYGIMPAVGELNSLKAEEIAAIMNHEKTSWGNNAKKVTPEEVQKIMDFIKQSATKQ